VTTDVLVARASTTRTRKRRINGRRIGAVAVMAILLFVTIFPFYWVVRTALSSNNRLAPASDSITPVRLTLGGFSAPWACSHSRRRRQRVDRVPRSNFMTSFRNSIIYAADHRRSSDVQHDGAYAFARMRFKGGPCCSPSSWPP
jgi:multiple sugar transport system permease protein